MSLIDDLKNLFSFHAETLDRRMGAMELHLSKIAEDNDTTARQIDYETKRLLINGVTNVAASEVFTVPAGSFYELVHWAFENNAEEVTPTVYVNGSIVDCPMTKRKCGVSNPNELRFMENDVITVKLTDGTTATSTTFMFNVYEVAPEGATQTGSGG